MPRCAVARSDGQAAVGVRKRVVFEPSVEWSVEVFESQHQALFHSFRDLLVESLVRCVEDRGGFFIDEGNLLVATQNADAIIDLAKNFCEVGRRHGPWHYSFVIRN